MALQKINTANARSGPDIITCKHILKVAGTDMKYFA